MGWSPCAATPRLPLTALKRYILGLRLAHDRSDFYESGKIPKEAHAVLDLVTWWHSRISVDEVLNRPRASHPLHRLLDPSGSQTSGYWSASLLVVTLVEGLHSLARTECCMQILDTVAVMWLRAYYAPRLTVANTRNTAVNWVHIALKCLTQADSALIM